MQTVQVSELFRNHWKLDIVGSVAAEFFIFPRLHVAVLFFLSTSWISTNLRYDVKKTKNVLITELFMMSLATPPQTQTRVDISSDSGALLRNSYDGWSWERGEAYIYIYIYK